MLTALQFVKGAVSKKDLQPILTHFHLYDTPEGQYRIQGYNGRIAIDAPMPATGIPNITVPADMFLKAMKLTIGEKQKVTMTDGKLVIKNGKTVLKLPVMEHDEFPRLTPQGGRFDPVEAKSNLIPVLKALRPFVSEDASRPWSVGVMVTGDMAYATNNVCCVMTPVHVFRAQDNDLAVNLPGAAVDELIRIGQEPKSMQSDGNSITFHYPDGSWLFAHLVADKWPLARLKEMLGAIDWEVPQITNELYDAVDTVRGFSPDPDRPNIIMRNTDVSTELGDKSSAQVGGFNFTTPAAFHVKPLMLALAAATYFDPSKYPKPCPFMNEDKSVKGVIMGVRVAGLEIKETEKVE